MHYSSERTYDADVAGLRGVERALDGSTLTAASGDETTFTVTATSKSGNTFTISRRAPAP